jgi:pSer/pThr/pTyr-binding forkhead associated (FHA) protein
VPARPVDGSTANPGRDLLAGAPGTSDRTEAIPTLVWLNGKDCGKRAPLLDEATLVGRGLDCAARVRDARASRRHAQIVYLRGEVRIFDLKSANGLRVDDIAVARQQRLFGGEVVSIGLTDLGFEAQLQSARALEAPSTLEDTAETEAPTELTELFALKAGWRRATARRIALALTAVAAAGFAATAVWRLFP